MNQHKVDRDSAGAVDLNDVRAKIRKIVREGFNLPGSQCRSQLSFEGHGWFGKRPNGFG
jgi:hypothetical protein